MFALSNGGCTGCSTAQPSLHIAIFPSFSSACSGNRGKLASLIDKLMFNQGMKCNSPLFVVPPPPNLWSLLPSFGEWDEISFSHEHYISQKAKGSFTSRGFFLESVGVGWGEGGKVGLALNWCLLPLVKN